MLRPAPTALALILAGCGGVEELEADRDDAAGAVTLGASVEADGVRFGVWAPHAEQVWVAGSFNGWRQGQSELARGAGGVFSGFVRGAKAGDEYKFILRNEQQVLWRADPRARRMRGEDGNSVVVDPSTYSWADRGFVAPAIGRAVVYELHVPSFTTGTDGSHGTFRTAIDRLDYLSALGINVIELMPIAEHYSGGERFGGWGYNPTEIFAPETDYGSPDDLRAFADAAHARGLAVILDWVPNHMSGAHTPMRNFDGETLGAEGIYYYTDGRRETGWGPRPDFGRPEVSGWLLDAFAMWIDEYHLDGARVDSVVTVRRWDGGEIPAGLNLLRRANDAARARGGKIMIAEDLQGWDSLTSETGTRFDSQWDDGFYWALKEEVAKSSDAGRDVARVAAAVSRRWHGRASERVIYTENHDKVAPHHHTERIPREISPDSPADWNAQKRSTLAAAVLFTAPGIPMLFQGQELLEDRGFTFPSPPPVDWSKEGTHSGIVQLYRDLIRLRTARPDTRGLRGDNVDVFHVNSNAKVIAYRRWDQGGAGDEVVVVANFSGRPFPIYTLGFPSAGAWKVRFNSDSKRYSPDFQGSISDTVTAVAGARDGLTFRGDVGIGPYSVVVLSQ